MIFDLFWRFVLISLLAFGGGATGVVVKRDGHNFHAKGSDVSAGR
jgi:hypothetical protein